MMPTCNGEGTLGKATDILQQELKKIGTHEDLWRMMIDILHADDKYGCVVHNVSNTVCQEQIVDLCRLQQRIGW